MNSTKHCAARQRQRGFSKLSMKILEEFGRPEYAVGNATKLSFGPREAAMAATEFKRILQLLDKVKGSTMVISADGRIVTVYHRT
ncbi:MAG: hypothetical protein DRJ18_01345 [Candidatus Methanomethylicota archaeon]|nr:MAG: hypothetical protein DRJ18_01345 [Candidatus Verstraetearchaeota archaeon]